MARRASPRKPRSSTPAILAYFAIRIRDLPATSTPPSQTHDGSFGGRTPSRSAGSAATSEAAIDGSRLVTLANWVGLHLGSLAGDPRDRRRALPAQARPLPAASQRDVRLRGDRLPLLRALPGRAAAAARPRAGRHRHRAVQLVPRAAAARPDEPVRRLPEPPRRLERPRRNRPLRDDGAPRRARVRDSLSAGDDVRGRGDGEPLHARRGRWNRGRARRAPRRDLHRTLTNGRYPAAQCRWTSSSGDSRRWRPRETGSHIWTRGFSCRPSHCSSAGSACGPSSGETCSPPPTLTGRYRSRRSWAPTSRGWA